MNIVRLENEPIIENNVDLVVKVNMSKDLDFWRVIFVDWEKKENKKNYLEQNLKNWEANYQNFVEDLNSE